MPTPYTEGNGCKYCRITNHDTFSRRECICQGPEIEPCQYPGIATAMYCQHFKAESGEIDQYVHELFKGSIMNESSSDDPVNHPSHYTSGGIECIDAVMAALSCHTDPIEAWLTGQCLKYLWRWPLKNGLEDLKKCQFYLNKLIEKMEE